MRPFDVHRLLDALEVGREKAKTADELADQIGTPQERTQLPIRELAEKANQEGFPVCSCSRGFFLADSREDLLIYSRSLAHRALALLERSVTVSEIAEGFGE